MPVTTAPILEGRKITARHGTVCGEAIVSTHLFKDSFAGIRDIAGGRSAAYEEEMRAAKSMALEEMIEQAQDHGPNAVIGVDLAYETVGAVGSMRGMVLAGGVGGLAQYRHKRATS